MSNNGNYSNKSNYSNNNYYINPFATEFFGLVVRKYFLCQF